MSSTEPRPDDPPVGEVPDFDDDDEAIVDAVWDRLAAEESDDGQAPRPPPDPAP